MQKEAIVYSFLDPIDFLNFEFRARQRRDPAFSLRKWALRLGYENPSFLSHILHKERRLKIEVAEKMAKYFGLNEKERSYFELILLRHNCESAVEKELYTKLLRKVRPKKYWDLDGIPLEKFEFASEWHNWAVLELVYLSDFEPTVEYIQAKLGSAVTKKMAQESVKKLVEIGLLLKTADGFRRESDHSLFLESIPSWAVDNYHRAMLEKAKEAISTAKPEERQSRGTMVALSRKNFEEAKRVMEEAHKRLMELSAQGDGECVFHLASCLFPVSKSAAEAIH